MAPEIEEYLRKFSDQYCKLVLESIFSAYKDNYTSVDEMVFHIPSLSSPLLLSLFIPFLIFQSAELLHHHHYRERKASDVRHRPQTLTTLLTLFEKTVPIAVYGHSGCGKSTLLAYAIKELSVLYPNAVIIYRFPFLPSYSSLSVIRSFLNIHVRCCADSLARA
jgi:Cdc6-like AAA superfamily ATPase